MNILSNLAQSTIQTYETLEPLTSSTASSTSADAAVAFTALVLIMLPFFLFFGLIMYVVSSLLLMRVFKKAGIEQTWAAWVPIYNNWKTLEIGGQQGWWAVLAIIPIVNIVSAVMLIIAMYHIGLKLGKSGAFVLLAIFLPIVWLIWLAVDKSVWNESLSSAPSLDPTTKNGTQTQADASQHANVAPAPAQPEQTQYAPQPTNVDKNVTSQPEAPAPEHYSAQQQDQNNQ